jgi:hypothetical protein
MLVSVKLKNDNVVITLALHLVYRCDTPGPIGYWTPLKAKRKAGPFSGSEDSFRGENEGTRSGGRKWRVFKSEGSDALLVFVWALNMSEIRG